MNDTKDTKSASLSLGFPGINSAQSLLCSDAMNVAINTLTSGQEAYTTPSVSLAAPRIPNIEQSSRSQLSVLFGGRKIKKALSLNSTSTLVGLCSEDEATNHPVSTTPRLTSRSSDAARSMDPGEKPQVVSIGRIPEQLHKKEAHQSDRQKKFTQLLLVALIEDTINLALSYNQGFSREEFTALNPEQLGSMYDSQEKTRVEVIKNLEQISKFCSDPSTSSISNQTDTSQGFFATKTNILSKEQHETLRILSINKHSSGIILLVDDSVVILKTIIANLEQYQATMSQTTEYLNPFEHMDSKEWQNIGIRTGVIANRTVICAANGLIAREVIMACNIAILITDYEMPLMNGGDLIKFIRSQEQLHALPILPIALHTTLSKEALIADQLNLDLEQMSVTYIEKNKSRDNLLEFFRENIPNHEPRKTTSTPHGGNWRG